MKKVYKIYELIDTSLESKTEMVGYDRLYYTSYLLRSIDNSDWHKSDQLRNGFESLEEAEEFIKENIEDYDKWTIIAEYEKV